MPFVISNPHPTAHVSGPRALGRIKKRDRHRHATGYKQRKQYRHQQYQRHCRGSRARQSTATLGEESSRRGSSLGDIITNIVRHQYLSYTQKKPPGNRGGPPLRSPRGSQLSALPSSSTPSGSASFSSGYYAHRLSSISASSSAAASIAVIPSRISSFSEQETTFVEPISRKEFSTPQRLSSPRLRNEVIDQVQMPVAPASTTARVAFGSLNSITGADRRTHATMGETTAPSVFLIGITSQCLHTLYAGSFVVYAMNLAADWLHTYYACKGWSVTFPLKAWLVIFMACCCTIGGVCNLLLLYLCIENALRRKWGVEPYEGGCRLICQRLAYWIMDFDCFRISFLILFFENAPMTVINYWFISSCSIPRPGKIGWTFVFACSATILSILWRALMTFIAYRNLRCVKRGRAGAAGNRGSRKGGSSANYFQLQQTPNTGAMTLGEMQHQRLEAKTSESSAGTADELRSLACGDRIQYYDECWPVRMSCWIMYNQRDESETESTGGPTTCADGEGPCRPVAPQWAATRPPDNCVGYCCQASCCFCLCVLFYAAMFATGCAPLAYHYTCRRHSRLHRHKFARTCTSLFSQAFNVIIVVVSIFLVISLLVINLIWLSSVQAIGHNRMPPEISQICLLVHPELRLVHPTLMTSIIPQDKRRHFQVQIECKPLFDVSDRWGFWWQRREPGSWLYQGMYDEDGRIDELAVKTETAVGRGADETTKIYVQFVHGMEEDCQYRVHTNWTIMIEPPVVPLPWPYWTACDRSYVVNENTADCSRSDHMLWHK